TVTNVVSAGFADPSPAKMCSKTDRSEILPWHHAKKNSLKTNIICNSIFMYVCISFFRLVVIFLKFKFHFESTVALKQSCVSKSNSSQSCLIFYSTFLEMFSHRNLYLINYAQINVTQNRINNAILKCLIIWQYLSYFFKRTF